MKEIHKIYEDKVDKLFNEAYQNTNTNFDQNEWQTLNKRIRKHNTLKKVKRISAILGIIGLITFIGFQFKNTKTKTTTSNTVASINNTPKNNSNNNTQQDLNNTTTSSLEQQTTTNLNTDNSTQSNSETLAKTRYFSPSTYNIANTTFTKNLKNKKIKTNKSTPLSEKAQQTNTLDQTIENNSDSEIANTKPNTQLENEVSNSNNIVNNKDVKKEIIDTYEIDASKNAIITNAVAKSAKVKKERKVFDIDFGGTNKILLDVFSGYNYSTKMQNNFTAFLGGNNYTTLRLQQEQSLPAISAGINVSFYKNNTSFTTGIQYFQQGDLIQYQDSTAKFYNGRTQFTYLEVPILIGKEFVKNRWGLSFKAGLNTGFLLSSKGKYVSITNSNSSYDVAEHQSDFKKVLFSLAVLPQLKYYLNNTSAFFIAPSYQRNLHSVTKTNIEFKQRYSIVGIKMGVSVNIK
jgi:hypothetical protein